MTDSKNIETYHVLQSRLRKVLKDCETDYLPYDDLKWFVVKIDKDRKVIEYLNSKGEEFWSIPYVQNLPLFTAIVKSVGIRIKKNDVKNFMVNFRQLYIAFDNVFSDRKKIANDFELRYAKVCHKFYWKVEDEYILVEWKAASGLIDEFDFHIRQQGHASPDQIACCFYAGTKEDIPVFEFHCENPERE